MQTKSVFPAKHFTDYAALLRLIQDLNITTKRFKKHSLIAKTKISEKIQSLQCFYSRELVYSNLWFITWSTFSLESFLSCGKKKVIRT